MGRRQHPHEQQQSLQRHRSTRIHGRGGAHAADDRSAGLYRAAHRRSGAGYRVVAASVRVIACIAVPLVSVAWRRGQLYPRTAAKHNAPLPAGLPGLQPDLAALRNGLCVRAPVSACVSAALRHAAHAVASPVPRSTASSCATAWSLRADVALHARTESARTTRVRVPRGGAATPTHGSPLVHTEALRRLARPAPRFAAQPEPMESEAL